jgi:hypothetical protein
VEDVLDILKVRVEKKKKEEDPQQTLMKMIKERIAKRMS